MLRVSNLHLNLEQPIELLERRALKQLHIPKEELISMKIVKESIDARKKGAIFFRYSVDCEVLHEKETLACGFENVSLAPVLKYEVPTSGEEKLSHRPIVIGFGPAGMFSALLLAQQGYCPIVIERGCDVDTRVKKVNEFWEKGILDEACNVQFGEGGAGTFSDGKLTTRVKDLRAHKILEEFVKAGSQEDILYSAHPHIGTDHLRTIVKHIREEIISLGGEVHFMKHLDDLVIENGTLKELVINGEKQACGPVVLAVGHSARDTFRMLHEHKQDLVGKAFAVGVRIEHKQKMVDESQYGECAGHEKLPAAEYRLTHKACNGRGVYTFCMCPGGSVVASTSQKDAIVVNGMSERARDGENANSALIVQVGPDDFGNEPLDGIAFQEALEKKAFVLGGSDYKAPAQCVYDFLHHRSSLKVGSVKPSYALGVKLCDLHDLFPSYINDAMEEGIRAFDKRVHGFSSDDAIMTGVESRTSSPLRYNRDQDTYMACSLTNLYPCGEGAGYAGGIVSAAMDGIRCSEAIIKKYQPWKK
ncbi:MAG: hypothetical protein RR941_01590 [Erysipelotrichaceae bacterium]